MGHPLVGWEDGMILPVPARKLRPSAALYAAGATGLALRCRRSDAAEVEPWRLGDIGGSKGGSKGGNTWEIPWKNLGKSREIMEKPGKIQRNHGKSWKIQKS